MNACQTTETEFHFIDEDRKFAIGKSAHCPVCNAPANLRRTYPRDEHWPLQRFKVVCSHCSLGAEVEWQPDSQTAIRIWQTYAKLVNS